MKIKWVSRLLLVLGAAFGAYAVSNVSALAALLMAANMVAQAAGWYFAGRTDELERR